VPVNVTVICQATVAELGWSQDLDSDGNDEIVSYTVYYSSSAPGAGSYESAEVAGNTTLTLVAVLPWLKYSFTVQAGNQIGRSQVSELVYCTTPETAPFEHPRNVCTQTRLSNQLVIVWQV